MVPSVMQIIDTVETEREVLSAILPFGRGRVWGPRTLEKQREGQAYRFSSFAHVETGQRPPSGGKLGRYATVWDILCTASRSRVVHFGLEGYEEGL
jgi:hypothetical protein